MNYESFLLIYFLCSLPTFSEERVCTSMTIQKSPVKFEKLKDCTKIVGYLKIVHMPDYLDYKLPSFPKLVEVTGYIALFSIPTLTSVGDMFPNLRLIRGHVLIKEAALIIYWNDNLVDLGLNNLLAIQRGKVVSLHSSKLCYINTVNWTDLGTSILFYDEKECENKTCRPECNGYCWSNDKCQTLSDKNCHPECIGCTKPNSSKDCLFCKTFNNSGTCVKECPPDKYINADASTCDTKKECENLDMKYVTFKNFCTRNCDKGYQLVSTNSTRSCIPCNTTNCEKLITCNSITVSQLTDMEYLKGCHYVIGNLEFKLTNTTLLSYLHYLNSIREIKGCLKVSDSSALKSLSFLKELRRIRGEYKDSCNKRSIYIHNNINLRSLWNNNEDFSLIIDKPTKESIEFHDNPYLCLSNIETFAKNSNISFNALDELKYVSLNTNGDEALCTILKIRSTIISINPNYVSLCWILDAEYSFTTIGYTIFYTSDEKPFETHIDTKEYCQSIWTSKFVEKNCYTITDLVPYTTYQYYIKVYSTVKQEGTSNIKNFTTPSGYPSSPQKFTLNSTTTSLLISWSAPKILNGNISYYFVSADLKVDDTILVEQRDYCKYPLYVQNSKNAIVQKKTTKPSLLDCDCNDNVDFFVNNVDDPFFNNKIDVFDEFKELKPKKITKPIYKKDFTQIYINSNKTFFEIKNLSYYSTYIVEFSACNINPDENLLCSRPIFETIRTKKNVSADNITDFEIVVQNYDVVLKWKNPEKPNGLLVAFNIQLNKSNEQLNTPHCLSISQHRQQNGIYTMEGLDPGHYSIRVRAISLAGPGYYTSFQYFTIKSAIKAWMIYTFITIIFCVILCLGFLYIWYKYRINLDDIRLIARINPDYESAIYIEDSWEMDRDDIEIRNEIGQGTFGLVYNGVILSQNKLCAIKTLNNTASISYRTNFLNEALVMKCFNEAHHVIKLYGVVSKGDPPLVVMELMERGDLKQYLRNSRESTREITTNEMYLMIAQIADGMAYLAAKKFVHRDLAARNCMVSHDNTVKIGDFGMTRDIYETDYYKKGTKGLLPVRWMAPESLADGVFTTKSDVWSYGIVLWEIVTLAEQPYQGMVNEQVLNFVISHGRLNRPPHCPDLIYEIMDLCWEYNSKHRPNFLEIIELLNPHLGPYFNLVSFYHSQAAKELRLISSPCTEEDTSSNNFYHLHDEYLELSQDDNLL